MLVSQGGKARIPYSLRTPTVLPWTPTLHPCTSLYSPSTPAHFPVLPCTSLYIKSQNTGTNTRGKARLSYSLGAPPRTSLVLQSCSHALLCTLFVQRKSLITTPEVFLILMDSVHGYFTFDWKYFYVCIIVGVSSFTWCNNSPSLKCSGGEISDLR